MTKRGAASRQICFKDMGGTRVDGLASEEEEFAFGSDSIAGAMRAFRQGIDFCAQYFFVRPGKEVPHPHMFAACWKDEDYATRRPLTPLALFSKTQACGAIRLRDHASADVSGMDYLGLLSNHGKSNSYYTYYLVNRSTSVQNVNLKPARSHPLYYYWLDYGSDTGRTIHPQLLSAAATVSVALPPRSMTALTEAGGDEPELARQG